MGRENSEKVNKEFEQEDDEIFDPEIENEYARLEAEFKRNNSNNPKSNHVNDILLSKTKDGKNVYYKLLHTIWSVQLVQLSS